MRTPTTRQDRRHEIVPGHLADYLAEVETWRLEALAARASRAVANAGPR
jgi:hypothetical protein